MIALREENCQIHSSQNEIFSIVVLNIAVAYDMLRNETFSSMEYGNPLLASYHTDSQPVNTLET